MVSGVFFRSFEHSPLFCTLFTELSVAGPGAAVWLVDMLLSDDRKVCFMPAYYHQRAVWLMDMWDLLGGSPFGWGMLVLVWCLVLPWIEVFVWTCNWPEFSLCLSCVRPPALIAQDRCLRSAMNEAQNKRWEQKECDETTSKDRMGGMNCFSKAVWNWAHVP